MGNVSSFNAGEHVDSALDTEKSSLPTSSPQATADSARQNSLRGVTRADLIDTVIERVEVDPAIIRDREFKTVQWTTDDVQRWLQLKGWGMYKSAFHEQKINGESLADLRPLSMVRELSVAPIHAFPLFNDISPLFLSSNFHVKDFDLEFRRKVDVSILEENPDKRITFRNAVELLTSFRQQDVELSDPALQFFIGKLGHEVLFFFTKASNVTRTGNYWRISHLRRLG